MAFLQDKSDSKPTDSSSEASAVTSSVSTSDQNEATAVHSGRTTLSQAKNSEKLTDKAKTQAKRLSVSQTP